MLFNHLLALLQDRSRFRPLRQPAQQSRTKHVRKPESELIAQNKGGKNDAENGRQGEITRRGKTARCKNQRRSRKRYRQAGESHDGEDDDEAEAGDKAE